MSIRIRFLLVVIATALLSPAFLTAGKPVNVNRSGVAIKGYDPVAYFKDALPTKGSVSFSTTWKEANWHFTNQGNLDAFKADPEKYAPQYGGYCAWAVSKGSTANIDPQAFKIVTGKLYLNYSLKIQKKWEGDIPGNIRKADANWPGVIE